MTDFNKLGGLWFGDAGEATHWFEKHDAEKELLATAFSHRMGFKAILFEKTRDWLWELPVWTPIRPEAIFDSQREAVDLVLLLVANTANPQ